MASSEPSLPASPIRSPSPPVVDDDDGEASAAAAEPDLPLTMTASVVLTSLPRDAATALAAAGGFAANKVVVRFKPVGSAPPVRRELCKISSTQRFEAVVAYLRRVLRVADTESVFLYVNSTFAPALDEIVGNLHRCFKDSNDQLNIAYSMTPAFG